MDQIAAEAEVSKRTVYNHFASKSELFVAIVGRLWGETRRATDIPYRSDASLREQLAEFARRKIELLMEPEYLGLMRAVMAECMRSPAIARETFDSMRSEEESLAVWIRGAAAEGRLSIQGADAAAAADQFWSLTKGSLFWSLLMGLPAPAEQERQAAIDDAVAMFLARYAAQPSD